MTRNRGSIAASKELSAIGRFTESRRAHWASQTPERAAEILILRRSLMSYSAIGKLKAMHKSEVRYICERNLEPSEMREILNRMKKSKGVAPNKADSKPSGPPPKVGASGCEMRDKWLRISWGAPRAAR